MLKRPAVEEVFTPRNRLVNDVMYIKRPKLEVNLLRAIRGSMHTMLFGESGNGKSWLYKHVFATEQINYVVANCGNASRLGSVAGEIHKACLPTDYLSKSSIEDTKEAGIKAVAEAKLTSKNKYDLLKDEPLLAAFKHLNRTNGKTVLVIENLEAIAGEQKLIDELCNIILLLDDERYAECDVKLLIVGTPNGVVDFFGKSKNLQSVTNRVTEVEKVTGLDDGQVSQLMTQGFSQLKITISTEDMAFLQRYMIHMTLGIAQRVHELCSCIAYEIQDHSWKFIRELLNSASAKWLNDSLRSSYVVIESHLNSIETTVGRRNQVIYAIGQINRSPILSADIEKYIREKFPDSIPETNMGIGSILTELCDSDNPILKKSDKHNHYVVLDPLHIMAIRLVLRKDSATNKIVKRTFKRN